MRSDRFPELSRLVRLGSSLSTFGLTLLYGTLCASRDEMTIVRLPGERAPPSCAQLRLALYVINLLCHRAFAVTKDMSVSEPIVIIRQFAIVLLWRKNMTKSFSSDNEDRFVEARIHHLVASPLCDRMLVWSCHSFSFSLRYNNSVPDKFGYVLYT